MQDKNLAVSDLSYEIKKEVLGRITGEDVCRVIQTIIRILQLKQEAKEGDLPGTEKKWCKSTGHRTWENGSRVCNFGVHRAKRRMRVAEVGKQKDTNQEQTNQVSKAKKSEPYSLVNQEPRIGFAQEIMG